MSRRDRRAALRAVQAAVEDAEGKIGVQAAPEPPGEELPAEAPEDLQKTRDRTTSADRTAFESGPSGPVVEHEEPDGSDQRNGRSQTDRRLAHADQPEDLSPASLESLLPSDWRERIDSATVAEAVELHGERVRRRLDEEMVYLAVRVPRSLRDAVRQRAERLDVSMQEFVIRAASLLLEATARAADT